MRIRELVSTFTTPFACCQPRVSEHPAGGPDPGRHDHPGRRARFSLNTALGERTRAPRLRPRAPDRRRRSWRTRWAAASARWRRPSTTRRSSRGSTSSPTRPTSSGSRATRPGREATVSWGGPELIVRNDWHAAILLKVTATDTSLTVRCTRPSSGRRVTTETTGDTPVAGDRFKVASTRKVFQGARLRSDDDGYAGPTRRRRPASSRHEHASATPSPSSRRSTTRSSGRASARRRWCSLAFLVTFGCVRGYAHVARHGLRAGQPDDRRHADPPHGPGHLPAARRGVRVGGARPRACPGSCGGCCRPRSACGAALVLDEYALWLNLRDVYWAEEGRRSIDAVIVAAALGAMVALGAPFWGRVISGADPAGGALIVAYHGVSVVSAVICLGKGKLTTGVVGFLLWPVGLIGAIRLAEPNQRLGAAPLRRRQAPPRPGALPGARGARRRGRARPDGAVLRGGRGPPLASPSGSSRSRRKRSSSSASSSPVGMRSGAASSSTRAAASSSCSTSARRRGSASTARATWVSKVVAASSSSVTSSWMPATVSSARTSARLPFALVRPGGVVRDRRPHRDGLEARVGRGVVEHAHDAGGAGVAGVAEAEVGDEAARRRPCR